MKTFRLPATKVYFYYESIKWIFKKYYLFAYLWYIFIFRG